MLFVLLLLNLPLLCLVLTLLVALQVSPQWLLQAQLHAGHHQTAERGLQNRRQQRRRGGRPTVLRVPVRQKGPARLTSRPQDLRQSASAQAQSPLFMFPLDKKK